jgi:hypothetical protein
MTKAELKKEVLSIAEYLGTNEGELWSEIEPLVDKYTEAAIEEALWHNNIGSE